LEERIIDILRTIYDPEIPVDIYELGLIYEVKIDDDAKAEVVMTLTSPSCPVAESMPAEVEEKVRSVEGVTEGKVDLTFDPPWDKDMMSEAAMLELGFM
jgi:FeS assembly SUF system protein